MIFYYFLSLLYASHSLTASHLPKPQAHIGVQIRSLNSGKVIFEKNAHETFIPASTLKLFTLATALHILKPSYRFETSVYYDGNLYLKGSGDPSLSVSNLDQLAAQIKQLIQKPIKNIILDSSIFDSNYYGKNWLEEDFDKGYAAPVSGININYNRLVVAFLPGNKLFIDPLTQFVKVKLFKKHHFKITGPGISISGTIPSVQKAQYTSYAIKDPNFWAGFLLKEALKRVGLRIQGKIKTGIVPSHLKPITSHHSSYLSEILINYTKFSNNLANEAILKTLGAGSFEKGLQIVHDHVGLKSIKDGSGLSELSRISPAQMTEFLIKNAKDFQIYPEFIAALPISGEDGSLKNSFDEDAWKGNIRAKTGGMTGVYNLAGYFKNQNGQIYAFSFFANDLKDSPKQLRNWIKLILESN